MNNDFMNRVNAIRSGNQPQPQPQNQYGAFAEMVPRQTMIADQPHMLAYINPQEEQMLRDMGGSGLPGPDGIPAYWWHDDDGPSFTESLSNFGNAIKDTFKEVTTLGKADTQTYNPTTYTPTVTTTPTNTNNNTTPVVTNTTPVVTNTTPTTTEKNTLYQNIANSFTPGDGKTYRDGVLVDESVGQYTSVDGGTTSNIRPLARSHTVDVDGSPLDFGAAGSDGVTRYVEDLERGQLTPSIYTPGYGDEDFDIGLGEQIGDYAKSALGSLIPGAGFMSVAKLLGKYQVNPSASDKVISKVDGQTIYQNADGDYYTQGGADNFYFTQGAYDPTPVSDNSENAGTFKDEGSSSLGALPGAAGAGGGGAGDQSSSILEYQRRRKGGGYGMLPEYMKKYITGEKIDETVRTVVLEDGTEVYVTMDGRMLSQDDLKNTALAGDIIRYNTAGDRVDIDGNIINSDGDRIDSDGNVMDAGIMAPQQIVEQSQERKDFIV